MYQGMGYDFASVVPTVLASGIVNAFVTFQAPSGVLTSSGAPDGNYSDVTGYVAIQCMNAPPSTTSIRATEKKTIEEIEASNEGHIWLAGFYPEIAGRTDWRAVYTDPIGNITYYDVLGSESDSQAQTTRVEVQVVTI